MTDINNLFFELIRVALGTQETLSHPPSKGEWKQLYDMAKKQSLVGICFAGLQKSYNIVNQEPITKNLDEVQYLTWMGLAAKIQQRNEVVNRQCVDLQKRLSADGFHCSILKGQGVASLYSEHLRGLRQSGDIDVWVQNKSIPELVEYVKGLGVGYKATAAHVECDLYLDTDVELHADPAFFRSFRNDRKLKRWFQEVQVSSFDSAQEPIGFHVPSIEFNLVYMMVHMYHHVLFEGLGLRQLMDYYFVLRTANKEVPDGFKFQEVSSTIESLGMKKFASGILWIIECVFNGNLEPYGTLKPFETASLMPSEKYGRLILEDVMAGGNFGHHDEKNKGLHGGTAVGRSLNGLKRNMKFFALGPWEILSSPLWSTWHWWWRKRKGFK